MSSPNISDIFEEFVHGNSRSDRGSDEENESRCSDIAGSHGKKARLSIDADLLDATTSDEDNPVQIEKFRFEAAIHEKNFKGQKSFEKRGVIAIQDNTVDGVLRQVWMYCKKYIAKAVEFKPLEAGGSRLRPEAAWCSEEPKFEEMGQFMVFQDKSGKRTTLPFDVTSSTLQSWLAKTIAIVVYRYSDSVSSAQKFNAVESQLLRPAAQDRAGAESIASLDQLKATLKSKHGHHLTADDINWSCWANFISTKPMTERDDLINQLPPRHLIGLFRTVPIHSDTVLTKTKLDLRIAENENKAYKRIVGQLKNDHQNLTSLVAAMGNRIAELESQLNEHKDMLTAMKSTVNVQDDEYSSSLAALVPDCVDIDHE